MWTWTTDYGHIGVRIINLSHILQSKYLQACFIFEIPAVCKEMVLYDEERWTASVNCQQFARRLEGRYWLLHRTKTNE
jgi:hypothetical protein